MPDHVSLLARGPWPVDAIEATWSDEPYEPAPELMTAADDAIRALRERGSPSHDGTAARMTGWRETPDGRLILDLQPVRWALRLVGADASDSVSALCVIRDSEGRWLAGRRAPWLSSWAGEWALGAGGAVDLGENPAQTLTRELREEWSVEAERVQGEALIRLSQGMILLVGQAWLPPGAEVTPDHEHDTYAWWPADPAEWPAEGHEPLRRMATLLDAGPC